MRIAARRIRGCVLQMTKMVECDYCGQFLDPVEEDAELYPVFVGEPPDPPEVECHGQAEKMEQVVKYDGGKQRIAGADGSIVLDQRVDHIQALLTAIEESRHFKLEVFNRVMDVNSKQMWSTDPSLSGDANDKMDRLIPTEEGDNTVAVDLKAQLHANYTADLMVCEYCRDTLKGEE